MGVSFLSPAVEFCGYTIPHPSDAKMHLRIQTTGKNPPYIHSIWGRDKNHTNE